MTLHSPASVRGWPEHSAIRTRDRSALVGTWAATRRTANSGGASGRSERQSDKGAVGQDLALKFWRVVQGLGHNNPTVHDAGHHLGKRLKLKPVPQRMDGRDRPQIAQEAAVPAFHACRFISQTSRSNKRS